jgi:hypothetical protein
VAPVNAAEGMAGNLAGPDLPVGLDAAPYQ